MWAVRRIRWYFFGGHLGTVYAANSKQALKVAREQWPDVAHFGICPAK